MKREIIITDKRIEALRDAVNEARRFITAAERAFEDIKTKDRIDSSKPFASAKRASMDLSNALVRVRNPGW